MAGFNFEKNLNHQSKAVSATVAVFDSLEIVKPKETDRQFVNPLIDKAGTDYARNIRLTRSEYGVQDGRIKHDSNIIDIMMETGTGKTYTYTKTFFGRIFVSIPRWQKYEEKGKLLESKQLF